jgi:hypothetical protein
VHLWATALLIAAASCKGQTPRTATPADAAPSAPEAAAPAAESAKAPKTSAPAQASEIERVHALRAAAAQPCLDAQLGRLGLNQFGDPPGTMYTGGTPLFDEKTGKSTDRAAYIFARHPDIARACGVDAGP